MGQNRTLHVLKMAVMLWGRKDEPGKARRKKEKKGSFRTHQRDKE
jgi:hypothetical protein